MKSNNRLKSFCFFEKRQPGLPLFLLARSAARPKAGPGRIRPEGRGQGGDSPPPWLMAPLGPGGFDPGPRGGRTSLRGGRVEGRPALGPDRLLLGVPAPSRWPAVSAPPGRVFRAAEALRSMARSWVGKYARIDPWAV